MVRIAVMGPTGRTKWSHAGNENDGVLRGDAPVVFAVCGVCSRAELRQCFWPHYSVTQDSSQQGFAHGDIRLGFALLCLSSALLFAGDRSYSKFRYQKAIVFPLSNGADGKQSEVALEVGIVDLSMEASAKIQN
ncbi:hypothetical protein CsSME_00024687 [Camellia sinensis var. sinensis]